MAVQVRMMFVPETAGVGRDTTIILNVPVALRLGAPSSNTRTVTGLVVPALGSPVCAKATADRQDCLHRVRAVHRHARLYESRASRDERFGHRHAQRHLFPGRAAL